jgi:Flp pilus assembly pilin Flp
VKQFLNRLWQETDGVLSFEWTMLTSLLTVGVVSGIAGVRDAVTDEMGDVAQAMVSLDQSYLIQPPLLVSVHSPSSVGGFGGFGTGGSSAASSAFIDAASYREGRGNMKVIELPRRDQPQPQTNPAAAGADDVAPELTPAL